MSDDPLMMNKKQLLDKCVSYHGHLCMGQVLGVHLALKGMELIGSTNPREMIVFVENDRCVSDAIQILTGTRLGRRTMKLRDYGKMAATFWNQSTDVAYRVWVSGELPKVGSYPDLDREKKDELLQKVLESDPEEILSYRRVKIELKPEELPGKPKRTVFCSKCNEKVMDGKDVQKDGGVLCLSCAEGAYYQIIDD